jgi:hypothetical protein
MNIVNDHDIRRSPDTSRRDASHESKIHVDALPPTLEEAPKPLWDNRLSWHDHAGPPSCLQAPVQAAQANAPLELKRSGHYFSGSMGMSHLYVAREEDGFFGLGYATAADRLEQVLLARQKPRFGYRRLHAILKRRGQQAFSLAPELVILVLDK